MISKIFWDCNMKYFVEFSENAKKDLAKHKKAGNKKVLSKLNELLLELVNHPFLGTGKPEILKYSLSGLWSRRLDQSHRVIYQVEENIVYILSIWGHYE
jgi:toxin YoeB